MDEIEQLKAQVAALTARLDAKDAQQIKFPLDKESIDILNKYFVRIVDEYVYLGGAGDNSFPVFVGTQDGKRFDVYPGNIRYTVEPSTNVVTIVDRTPYTRFGDDETMVLFTTDTMPSPLSGQGLTTYYVISAASDGYSFKLSATLGGSEINITDVGVGKQFLTRI